VSVRGDSMPLCAGRDGLIGRCRQELRARFETGLHTNQKGKRDRWRRNKLVKESRREIPTESATCAKAKGRSRLSAKKSQKPRRQRGGGGVGNARKSVLDRE